MIPLKLNEYELMVDELKKEAGCIRLPENDILYG